jgi:hypothetical protein
MQSKAIPRGKYIGEPQNLATHFIKCRYEAGSTCAILAKCSPMKAGCRIRQKIRRNQLNSFI